MKPKIVVRHFHDGNDADHTVRAVRAVDAEKGKNNPPLYATRATVVDLETGKALTEDFWAFCSPRDVPSRKRGRQCAVGRLLKKHPQFISEVLKT